jgi:HSP20 family protein
MRQQVHVLTLPSEASEFADELRRMFLELGRSALTGECSPPLDVFESDEKIEIVMDLPAVSPDAVRIAAIGNAVLIAGEKTPRRNRGDASFHLVERGYGRFARVVRLVTACDLSRARAAVRDGELRVSVPKIKERRGRAIPIAPTSESPTA